MQEIKQVQFTVESRYAHSIHSFYETYTFTLEIGEKTTLKQAIDETRQKLAEALGSQYSVLINERNDLVKEIEDLESKVAVARTKWEDTQQFLAAQGIKTDAAGFPNFNNYLLPSSQETVDAELEDEDEDDDDDDRYSYEM